MSRSRRVKRIAKASTTTLAVLGAGAWGTTLAILLARNGCQVHLWDYDAGHLSTLDRDRCNHRYLGDIKFPNNLFIVKEISDTVKELSNILLAVPSHGFRDTLMLLKPHLHGRFVRIVWGTKGLDPSGCLLSDVVSSVLGDMPMAAISGPSFAREVAAGLPAAIVSAAKDRDVAETVAGWLRNDVFRVYTSTDMMGVQICGAVKNVLAIAVGVSDGMLMGANARCALITRGLAELACLGEALGGCRSTFMGLAGMGDLVLTCTDDQSRNRRFGLFIGRGMTMEQAIRKIAQVIEGRQVARQLRAMAQKYGVEMPVCEQVYRLVEGEISGQEAVNALMARPPPH